MRSDAETAAQTRPLTGGVVMGAASRVTVAVTGALTTIFVARLLGPAGSGAFAIALTVVLMLTVLTTLGVEHGVAYYVAAGKWGARSAMAATQRVALGMGVVGALFGLAARLAVPEAFGGLSVATTAVAAAALPFALSWFYLSFIALAVDHYEGFVVPPAVQSTVALVAVVGLGLAADVPGTVIGLAGSHVLTAVLTSIWAIRRLPATETHEPGQLRRAVSFGAKGYAANALQFLNYRLDLFILSAVTTASEVGHYAVALAVATVLWLLPQALGDVLFPRIAALSHSAAKEASDVRGFVEAKSLRHAVAIVVIFSAVLAAALLFLVVPIYGSEFRPAIEMGLILLPGVALVGIANVMSATIVGRGRPVYSLYIALLTTPLTVALYAMLIPSLDGTGAAIAKSLSFTASFMLAAVYYRKVTGDLRVRMLVPTGSELADYRGLPRAVREWAKGRGA